MVKKQKGAFIVELAIVSGIFSLLLVFSIDIILKLSMQGKLDRLSYSTVSILAERRQLFGGSESLCTNNDSGCSQPIEQLYTLAENSMARMYSNFDSSKMTVIVEQQAFNGLNPSGYYVEWLPGTNRSCKFTPLNLLTDLSPVTSHGRHAPLYQVTVCYESDDYTTVVIGSGFTTLASSSVMIGRS